MSVITTGGSPKIRKGNLIVFLSLFFSLQVFALPSPTDQFSEAKKLITEGQYAEAEASVRELIARQPSPEGFDLLGYIYEQQRMLDRAEDAYGQALKLDAGRHFSKVRLGIVYGKEGKYADCVAILEGVYADVRGDPEALFYLCRAYLEVGKTDKALETAEIVEGL